jgi:hypothetical protein
MSKSALFDGLVSAKIDGFSSFPFPLAVGDHEEVESRRVRQGQGAHGRAAAAVVTGDDAVSAIARWRCYGSR